MSVKAPVVRHALRRGVFHALVGLAVAVALLLLPRSAVLAALAGLTAAFLSFEVARLNIQFLNQLFLRWFARLLRPKEWARLTGSSYFLVACLIAALAFPKHLTATAILFLSFGDPAATVIGLWKGRTMLGGKSLEGHAACLAVCCIVAIIAAATWQDLALPVAIVGAVSAALFQALPVPLNDNLTILLGSATIMRLAELAM